MEDSKKKDLIILLLFLLSFVLFVVSLYFTFMKEKTPNLTQDEMAEITNVDTGNIAYNRSGTIGAPAENAVETQAVTPALQ